jgi:hypothetical protein
MTAPCHPSRASSLIQDSTTQAIQRWISALNAPHSSEKLQEAVDPGICVERYGFGEQTGQLVEEFAGIEEVESWIKRSPPDVTFATKSAVAHKNGLFEVDFHITAPEFDGGGSWRFTLSSQHRINWLEHRPDNLK